MYLHFVWNAMFEKICCLELTCCYMFDEFLQVLCYERIRQIERNTSGCDKTCFDINIEMENFVFFFIQMPLLIPRRKVMFTSAIVCATVSSPYSSTYTSVYVLACECMRILFVFLSHSIWWTLTQLIWNRWISINAIFELFIIIVSSYSYIWWFKIRFVKCFVRVGAEEIVLMKQI